MTPSVDSIHKHDIPFNFKYGLIGSCKRNDAKALDFPFNFCMTHLMNGELWNVTSNI